MQPHTPTQGEQPSGGDCPFGSRWVDRIRPDGSITHELVPYTVEDVLHPEPDDVFPVRPQHAIDTKYLVSVFRVRAAAELSSQPIVYVSDDHLVDWGVPGQRNTSPDVGVFAGLREPVAPLAGMFDLHASGGRCVLVVEVVSPDKRRDNDVVDKFREYYNAGVPLYVIVDQEKERGPRKVIGYRHRPQGYEELPLTEQGLLLGPLQLYLSLKEGRVVCYDARTGKELGDYCRIVQELEEATEERDEARQELEVADRRIAEQEQALEQAFEDNRQQRQAREEAERQADEQRQAREEADRARETAEKREKEQTLARQEAERQQRLQREAREAAEERIRQLETALAALQPPS
jgi:hypothetical protein